MVRLKTQYETAMMYQNHESLRMVAYEALGGKWDEAEPDPSEAVQTFDELKKAFMEFGGSFGG